MNNLNDSVPLIEYDKKPEVANSARRIRSSLIRNLILGIGLPLFLSLLVVGVSFGSVASFMRYYRGETLVIDERDKSFGVVPIGETRTISFKLTNESGSPIKILGCSVGCACTIPETLPMVVGPGESRPFQYTLRTTETSRPNSLFLKSILYTNNPRQREIHLSLSATLKDRDASPVGGQRE